MRRRIHACHMGRRIHACACRRTALIVNSSEELEIDEFSDEFSLELDRSDLGPSLRAASSQP